MNNKDDFLINNSKYECLEDFTDAVVEALSNYYGDEADIRRNKVSKNNGIVLTGISILMGANCVSPTLYAENYYLEHQNGKNFGDIILEMINIYDNNQNFDSIDVEFYKDYQKVRENIVYKLVNKEKNQELLKEIPYFDFLDMAIVFSYIFENSPFLGEATILVRNSHIKMWNISKDELFNDAKINSERLLSYKIDNIQEIIKNIMFDKIKCQKDNCDDEAIKKMAHDIFDGINDISTAIPMFVLTNKRNSYGASCILYDNVLREFALRLESDLVILPSSIHEVILIPVESLNKKTADVNYLRDMVKEVNTTQVSLDEILSDSVYIYSKSEDKIDLLLD